MGKTEEPNVFILILFMVWRVDMITLGIGVHGGKFPKNQIKKFMRKKQTKLTQLDETDLGPVKSL